MEYIELALLVATAYLAFKIYKDHEERLYRLEYKVLCKPIETPPFPDTEEPSKEEVVNGE